MLTTSRRLLAAFALIGVAGLAAGPDDAAAQAKKDDKKEMKKDDPKEMKKDDKKDKDDPKEDKDKKYRTVGINTSDGLELKGYWWNSPKGKDSDIVLMVPSLEPKSELAKGEWLSLGTALQEKGFAVLTFDWRGHGLNGPSATSRVFGEKSKFWDEPYNKNYANTHATSAETLKGLDATKFSARYTPFLMNDLQAARRFIDAKNDQGECNAFRITIVTEKEAGMYAAWFIGTEFSRNTFSPKSIGNPFDIVEKASAGKDYCGLVVLDYKAPPGSVKGYFEKAPSMATTPREASEVLRDRLTVLLLTNENETSEKAARSFVGMFDAGATKELQEKRFKYVRPVKGSKTLSGIALVDAAGKLPTQGMILEFLEKMQERQVGGSAWKERNPPSVPNAFPLSNYGILP